MTLDPVKFMINISHYIFLPPFPKFSLLPWVEILFSVDIIKNKHKVTNDIILLRFMCGLVLLLASLLFIAFYYTFKQGF